jgi:hypothetical protein
MNNFLVYICVFSVVKKILRPMEEEKKSMMKWRRES